MTRTTPRAHPRPRTHAGAAALLLLATAPSMLAACRTTGDGPESPSGAPSAVTATLGAAAPGTIGSGAGAASSTELSASAATTPTMATHLTAEDETKMVALVRTLFGPVTGTSEPDMQDVVVRQLSTIQLRQLRGEDGPDASTFGYSAGLVWVVGFKTSAPLTLSTFAADETSQIELKDFGATKPLAGPDGRTSVFYVVSTQTVEGDMRFVPRSQGVVVEGYSSWSLDDLAKLPATP